MIETTNLQEKIVELEAQRATYFSANHDNRFARDRYDQWDRLTREIYELERRLEWNKND